MSKSTKWIGTLIFEEAMAATLIAEALVKEVVNRKAQASLAIFESVEIHLM